MKDFFLFFPVFHLPLFFSLLIMNTKKGQKGTVKEGTVTRNTSEYVSNCQHFSFIFMCIHSRQIDTIPDVSMDWYSTMGTAVMGDTGTIVTALDLHRPSNTSVFHTCMSLISQLNIFFSDQLSQFFPDPHNYIYTLGAKESSTNRAKLSIAFEGFGVFLLCFGLLNYFWYPEYVYIRCFMYLNFFRTQKKASENSMDKWKRYYSKRHFKDATP